MAQTNSKSKPLETSTKREVSRRSLSNRRRQSNYSVTLWPEHVAPVEQILSSEATAVFAEQRTGKTFMTMGVLERLPRENLAAVIVCLLTNRDTTWRDKLAEFLPWLNVTSDWEEFKKLPFPKAFLIHFDMLPKVASKLKRATRWLTFCAIDEAHRLKARGSAWSRAAAKLSGIAKRVILTGTPIEKQPKDLWAQFRFLMPGLLGETWADFENEYIDLPKIDWKKYRWGSSEWQQAMLRFRIMRSKAKFKRGAIRKLTQTIKPYCVRLTKQDVGIKAPIVHKIDVPLVGPQKQLYHKMKRTSVIKLPDGSRAMAPLKITNIIKRRQIASGFVFDDDEVSHTVGRSKLLRLRSLVRKLPKPIVVFAVFRPEIDAIEQCLVAEGYDVIAVHGKVSKKLRPDIWRRFQKAQWDVIVCQTRTGGIGVDLWKARRGIFHSLSHSSIDFDQAKSRLDTKHYEDPAEFFVLCGKGTIDEDLYDMVVEKGLGADQVLSKLKKGDVR